MCSIIYVFFFKQKTAYDMRISDWSSDVCSSDLKAAEMSQIFAQLAQDLGSFYNVDTETAIQKLRSGLSGESEPLRDFGVFLTEANVKAKALEIGLTGVGEELTEQEKILARNQLVLEAT